MTPRLGPGPAASLGRRMTPREIRTDDVQVRCAVCGRSLLRGEAPEAYLHDGQRRDVCELCTGRAEREGWIREAEGQQIGARAARDRRGLLSRLRQWQRSRPHQDPGVERNGSLRHELRSSPHSADELFAPQGERHVHAVPTSDQLKMSRALDLFNISEHPRTVAGVARSLGPPAVAVLPVENSSVVTVTVAWELCWYRYEVDLADERGGVRVADQGYELEELSESEQVANAAADDRGVLQPAA
jgi:hypothetical protein